LAGAAAALLLLAPAAVAATEEAVPVVPAPDVPGHGRSWELVTPPGVSSLTWEMGALSPSGDRLVYKTFGLPPGAPHPRPINPTVLAVRGPNGWEDSQMEVPFPESEEATGLGPLAFDPTLTESLWSGPMPAGRSGFFMRGPTGAFSLLSEPGENMVGASTDLQRFVYSSSGHILPADAARVEGASLYEVEGGVQRLVDQGAGGALLSICGTQEPKVSRDARRIFFQTGPYPLGAGSPCEGEPNRVYLRENRTTTTEISASQCDLADCGPTSDINLKAITPDGSGAFLETSMKLTDEDSDETPDIYRYDVGDGTLTLLTEQGGLNLTPEGGFHPSPDGSRAFLQARDEGGDLASYLADAAGLHPAPVALASGFDLVLGFLRWSDDGRYAVFPATEQLSPEDTDAQVDIYRYDAVDDSYALISAARGMPGNGAFDAVVAPAVRAESETLRGAWPSRVISADGSRVFFTTAEQLVPGDRNQADDVYEWANGDVALVSAGVGDRPSAFLGSTPDGSTALFRTTTTLLRRDRDGGDLDFYVARIGGGFPEPPPASDCGGSCARRDGGQGRLAVVSPPSAGQLAGGVRLQLPDAAARRRMATSGRLTLLAEVPRAGRLSASASARIGSRKRTVAQASAEAKAAGSVQLSMRLSKAARARLAAGRNLRLDVLVRLASVAGSSHLAFSLERPR
jgi:hypothetical protein